MGELFEFYNLSDTIFIRFIQIKSFFEELEEQKTILDVLSKE